jgi:hypothetical protein
VLYASIPDSRWTIRAIGEPGIALQDGQQIDLFELARQRVSPRRTAFPSILRRN